MAQMTPEDIIRQRQMTNARMHRAKLLNERMRQNLSDDAMAGVNPNTNGIPKQETERPSADIPERSVIDKVRSSARKEEMEKAARIRSSVNRQKSKRARNLDREADMAELEDIEGGSPKKKNWITYPPEVPETPGARVDRETAKDTLRKEREGIAEGKRQDRESRETRYQEMLDGQIDEAAKEGKPDNMTQEEYRESIRRNAMRNINQARASKTRGEQERDFEQQEEDFQKFRVESDQRIADDEEYVKQRRLDMQSMEPADYFRKYGDESSAARMEAMESQGNMLDSRTDEVKRENAKLQSMMDNFTQNRPTYRGEFIPEMSDELKGKVEQMKEDGTWYRPGQRADQTMADIASRDVHPMNEPLSEEDQARKDAAEAAIPEGMKRYKGSGADLGRLMSDEDYDERMASNRERTERNRKKRKDFARKERYYKKHLRPGEVYFQTWGLPGGAAGDFGQSVVRAYQDRMNMPLRQQELEANRDLAREQMQSNEEIARMQYGSNDDKDKYAMNMGMLQVINQQIQALPFGSPQRRRLEQQRDQLMASMMSSGSGTGGSGAPTTPSSSSTAFDSEEMRYMPQEEFENIMMTQFGDLSPVLGDLTEELAGQSLDDMGQWTDDAFDDMADFLDDMAVHIMSGAINQENLPFVMEHMRRALPAEIWNHMTGNKFGVPESEGGLPQGYLGGYIGGYDTEEITPAMQQMMKDLVAGRIPSSGTLQTVAGENYFMS